MKLTLVLTAFGVAAGTINQNSTSQLTASSDAQKTQGAIGRHEAEVSTHARSFLKDQRQFAAVCFIGQLRRLTDTAPRLRTELLEPMASGGVNVDVYVAAEQGGPFTVDDFGFPYNSQLPITLRNSTWRRHQTGEEITNAIEQKAPYKACLHYMFAPGNSNWVGPMYNHLGNGLRFYRLERDCIDMLEHSEKQDSKTYKWLIRTRPDLVWMAPHPPLALMSLDRVWVLDGEHYGGISSRHMVGSRDMMVKLLDRLRLIETGDPVIYKMKEGGPVLNDEYFHKVLAREYGAVIGTIAYPAFLIRNPGWVDTGWRRAGVIYPEEESDARKTGEKASEEKACWQKVSDDHLDIRPVCGDNPLALWRNSSLEVTSLASESKPSSQNNLPKQASKQTSKHAFIATHSFTASILWHWPFLGLLPILAFVAIAGLSCTWSTNVQTEKKSDVLTIVEGEKRPKAMMGV